MKEQQERVASKQLSSEYQHQHEDQLGQQQTTMTEEVPPLTIAVTMSEDDHDEYGDSPASFAASPDPKDVSAWALLEHYPNQQEDEHFQQHQKQHQPQSGRKNNNTNTSLILETYTFQSSDSEPEADAEPSQADKPSQYQSQYRGKRFTPAQQEIFVVDHHDNYDQDDDSEPEPVVDTTLDNDNNNEIDTSARSTSIIEDSLEWHSNPYGEMTPSVRAKKYSRDDSIREEQDEISNIDDTSSANQMPFGMSPAGRHVTSYSYTQDDNEQEQDMDTTLQDQDLSGEQYVDDDEYFANPLVTAGIYGGQPTPARVRTQWQEEKKLDGDNDNGDDDESAPISILQESMIQSQHANSKSDNNNTTQLSIASLQLSEDGAYEPAQAPTTPLPTPSGNKEQFAYLARIGELEASLQHQQLSQDSNQSKMQQRVVELEQALKVTAATPRGTIVENPLHSLLQRNQTLVKEVRFADQTCVELGSKNSALQAQVQILQEQLSDSRKETNELRREFQTNNNNESISSHSSSNQVQQLQQDLKETKALLEQTKATSVTGEAIRSVLRELKQEVGALERESLLEQPTEQLSQDTFLNDTDDDPDQANDQASYNSHCLAKALHLQIQRLRQKAQQAETSQLNISVQLSSAQTKQQALLQRIQELELEGGDDDDQSLTSQLVQAQAENDFLGRQLGNAQEKLEQARHLIQSFGEEELKSKDQTDQQALQIQTLTSQLKRASDHMYLYEQGPTSPRLQTADKRAFRLEKELAHAQASLVAMKRESEKLLSQAAAASLTANSNSGSDSTNQESQVEVMNLMQVALRRMMDEYQRLEHQVTTATDEYADRLGKMAETVSYLRSALVFDIDDSVSTQVQDATGQTATNNYSIHHHQALHSSSISDDDEMYRLMEEARSPPSIKFGDYDETSSNMGDVSHLFSDDGTLVSVHQRGGSMSGDTKWKAPLEAAVRECQRVREQLQSVQRTFGDERQRLQGEMTRLQTTIERLEVENVKLSVEAIRKAEETGLLEAALAEAQQNIAELQSLFESTVSERDDAIGDTEDKTKQLQQLEQDKAEIEQTLGQAIEENASLESQVQTSEKERDELSSELQAVSASLEEAHKESSGLLYQLRNKETELDQRHQHEMDLLRQALRQSESELEQANHLQETSDSKLNLFADEKSKFESMVADLQASRQEFFSQTEDKVLEAEYKLEDMRKERSELKSRLSRVEKELASAKESFSLYKNRVKERLDDRESVIAALQSERSQAYDCAQEMVLLRRDLFQSLESAQVCPDVVRRIQSQDQSSFDDGSSLCTKEVEFWKEVIPAVGSSMQELSHAKSQLEDAERESERLTEDLARLESAEGDCQKQVEDERLRNEKLFALLRQAESEMERSVAQIRDMSSALVLIQEREAEAKAQARCMEEEWYAQKTDLEGSLEKITAEKGQAQTRLLGMEETLTTIQGSLSETTKRL
jgi:hypothetical protein